LKPKNNGSFPIAEAKDIDVNGVRLDEKLESLGTGGGGGGGIKSITFTDRPTLFAWLVENYTKLYKTVLEASLLSSPIEFNSVGVVTLEGAITEVKLKYFSYGAYAGGIAMSFWGTTITNEKTIMRSGDQITISDNGEITVDREEPTELPDAYWSSVNAKVTCYYIE
jgi:hypothetical protein